MNLSVGLITYNEALDLPRTLTAIKDIADEIVIVDNGSVDHTLEIAKSFGAKVFHEEWKGFGKQKNSVIEKCQGKWILFIDADEVITPKLKEEIKKIIVEKESKQVYKIRFQTFCFGNKIHFGGWNHYYRIRLFMKDSGKYNDSEIHEKFVTDYPIGRIKQDIFHYTYRSKEEYEEKMTKYAEKMAETYVKKGKQKSRFGAFLSGTFAFVKMYLLQLGFLDGKNGFILAQGQFHYTYSKYLKIKR
jgi:glycosyltransferase involved in cell wall biosynthesis